MKSSTHPIPHPLSSTSTASRSRLTALAARLAMLALLATLSGLAGAQTLYWDANGATGGAGGATPTGIWGTDLFWSTAPDGTVATAAWVAGNIAVFSAGSDATGAFTVTVSGTQTAGGMIIEEGTVTLTSGTVALGTGNLTVNAPAILSTDSSLRISASAGATVTLNGGTLRTTNPGAAGTFYDADFVITLGSNGGTFSHVTTNILNIVQTATTVIGPGSLTKTGIGVLAIAGTCSYSGSTIINDGELRIRSTADRLPTTTAVIVNSPGILNLNGVNQQIGSLSGNGDVGLSNGRLTLGDATSTLFTGAIKDIANYGAGGATATGGRVVKQGNGTLTFAGVNTFTGRFTNNAGTVTVNPGAALCGPVCDVNINGGIVNLSNAAQTIENLTGTGGVINLGTGHTLTTDPLASTTFSGTLAGPGGLTKANVVSGTTMRTLTLNGPNTYDGPTLVSGGKIAVGSATALGSTAAGTTVASGAEILFDGAATAFTISEPFTIAGPGAGDGGAITVQNSANVTISGPVTLTGDTTNTVSGTGTVLYNNPSAITALGDYNLTLQGGSGTGGGGTVSGVIALGAGRLIKLQGGRWTLSGANTYSGGTIISNGTLVVTNTAGSGTGSGSVTVYGGTLAGAGAIAGDVTVTATGTLAPGSPIGTLSVGSLSLSGTAVMELNKAGSTLTSDRVVAAGALACGGTLTILATGDPLAAGDTFDLFDAASFTGSFTQSNLPALPAGLAWDTTRVAVNGALIVHRSPVAGDDTAGTLQNRPTSIPVVKLLENDTDADADALSITAVSATSTNGGTVVLASGLVTYTPVAGFTGVDRFTYTVSDGRGGTATGTVTVTVTLSTTLNLVAGPTLNGGLFSVTFAGIPGYRYTIETATNVTGPWTVVTNLTVPANGLLNFTDPVTTPPPLERYYRTMYP